MDLLRSLPIGLYLEQPYTWLHRLDPRVKLGWLMSFLLAPLLANAVWRVGLVLVLIGLTLAARIPLRVWRQQMGWLLMIAIFAFLIACVMNDGLALSYQPRLPASVSQDWPQPTDYRYILLDLGRLQVTRRSFDLALRLSTIIFTLIYSTNLYLLTTAPEEITTGLERLLHPLRRFQWPITEIILTLTLALRFIPLVLEEVQNLVRSIRTRAIAWNKLGLRQSCKIWLVVVERLLENLLLRAEQIAVAMHVRGFTSPNRHQVQWHQLRLGRGDGLALAILVLFWWARLVWGWMA